MTIYSGGPLHSPYSQVVLAYPLFSVMIARNRSSLVGVYLTTILSLVVCEIVFQVGCPWGEVPGDWWYRVTTVLTLLVSGIVAILSMGIDRENSAEESE